MTDLPSTVVRPAQSGAALLLVVVGEEHHATHTLPSTGQVTLGRAPTCDLRIEDKTISRHHAILHIGAELAIEDLESANGTRVGGRAIEPNRPTPVKRGELIELGEVALLIQRRGSSAAPRRLWPHGYFEARLDDECLRARDGTTFSVVFLRCDGKPAPDSVRAALAESLSPVDVSAEYAPAEYEVLLVDAGPERADECAAELLEHLASRGVRARAGVASFPRDGKTSDGLLALATSRVRPRTPTTMGGVVIEDPAMVQLRCMIDRVATGTLSVLLLGETGVGKEILAEYVHQRSPRRDRPFLRLNCAAMTETLLENELFGHEKGAFTGATAIKPGLLETASGGTVFLDEIGEISATLQVKLLRVLEERRVTRVGGLKPVALDVRFVAATNRDLEHEIASSRFRQDLYYRLAGISLVIPPLRERPSEILPLARSFIALTSAATGRVPELGNDAIELLTHYAWPGNIRELRNVIERAVLLCTNGVIGPEHLPLDKMRATYAPPVRAESAMTLPPDDDRDEGDDALGTDTLEALYIGGPERERIIATLEHCRGNQTKAAQILGMSRRTLINRIQRYSLPRPRKR